MASGSEDAKEEIVQGLRGPSFSPALAWSSESNPSLTSDLWLSAAREAQVVAVHSADTNSGTLSAGPGIGMSQPAVGGSNCPTAISRNSTSAVLPGPASKELPFGSHSMLALLSGPGRQLTFPKGAGTGLSVECTSHLLFPETN